MKSMATKILALTAAFCGLQLSAATPVAVWDGDFKTTTKGGWTLSSTGSTITDSSITIGTTPITVTPSSTQNGGWYTIIYKVKGLKNTSQTPLATWGRPKPSSGSYNDPDLIGAFLDYDYVQGVWNGAEYAKSSQQTRVNLSSAGTEEHRVIVRFHSGVDYGVWAYVDGTKVFTADKGLKSSMDVNRMTILGFQYNNGNVLKGAVVTGIAIFSEKSDAGDAAFTSYKFPSDPQAQVISVNFNASTSARTVTGDPGAVYSDSKWYNLTGSSGTDVGIDKAKISYSAKDVYNNDNMNKVYLKGYLDDNNSTHTTVTVSNLKNGYYNLVIYCSSDNAAGFSYKTVNNVNYTWDSTTGAAKVGTTKWGSNDTSATTEPGKHALLIKNLKVDNGTIAIDSLRRDEGETRVRGSISAIQIAEVPYEATVTQSANWADLNWTPSVPTAGADVKLINNGADGVTTITLADNVSVGKLTVESAAGKELKIANFATKMTATLYDFSKAAGGVGLDVSSGYTIVDPLKSYLRDNDVKVAFYGADGKGATIDYGVGNATSTKGHHVFEGGTHALTYGADSAILSFSSTGTLDNPAILVRDGATLNFTMKDLNGWNGTRQDNAVMRVASGATLNFLPSGTATMFMSGRLVMEPGSTTTFKTGSSNYGFCVYGGADASSDTTKAQLYVPSPAQGAENTTAILKKDPNSAKNLEFGKSSEGTGGAAITVSNGSTLDVQSPLSGAQAVNKYGRGTIKFSDAINGYTGSFTVSAGAVDIAHDTSMGGTLTVNANTMVKFGAIDNTYSGVIAGQGSVLKDGANTSTILSGDNTYSGGTTINAGVLVLGSDLALGSGAVTIGENGRLDLNGHTVTISSLSGSGTICNSSAKTANINGVPVVKGKSVNLSDGKIRIVLGATETLALSSMPPNGTVTIGGAGKVAFTTTAEAPAYPTWTWIADGDDAWTGTYALTGFTTATTAACGNNGWDFRPYYNGTKSVFEVVGSSASATVTGYFLNQSFSVGELVLSGAVKIENGYSNYTYSFTKISGSKAFTINTGTTTITATIKFADISAFTGTLSVSSPKNGDKKCYCLIVGNGTLPEGYKSDMSSIYLTGDTVLNGTTLNASNGVKVNGDAVVTVPAGKRPTCSSGVMTLEDGSSVVFGNGSCNLTANGGLSIASNVKIPLAITNGKDLTAGAILVNWSGTQPTGDFSFSIESGVEAGQTGFKASKNDANLTAIADTTKTYYEVEGGETTTTFDNTWLTDAKITGSTTEEVQEKLDTPNANGIKMSDVYLMGYEAKDAQNAAVILKPDQAQSNGEAICLSVAGVPATTRNGATVSYTALASTTRDWEKPTVEKEMDALSVDMALPTSGVLYYRIQANVALP